MSSLFSDYHEDQNKALFDAAKPSCVSLLKHAKLSPNSTPLVSKALKNLLATLQRLQAPARELTPNLISYIFFPLSTILRRNESPAIPNHILESIWHILSILSQRWWWDCELELWDQLLILSCSILDVASFDNVQDANIQCHKRDEETNHAVVLCLLALLTPRSIDPTLNEPSYTSDDAKQRFETLQLRSQTVGLISIFGRMLNKLLTLSSSLRGIFQEDALRLTHILVLHYIPRDIAPAVLPGVVSTCIRVALGHNDAKGWTSGTIIFHALEILKVIILNAVGDDICLAQQVVSDPQTLDDLTRVPLNDQAKAYEQETSTFVPVPRTVSWLRGTATQLHIALNSLSPLLRHPNHHALLALSSLSHTILRATSLTLAQSQTVLISFLLSLSTQSSESVSSSAYSYLVDLLSFPQREKLRIDLARVLIVIAQDSLVSLPRAALQCDEVKVERLSRQIDAICRITLDKRVDDRFLFGFKALLGADGGVEKWGWSLLSALELEASQVSIIGNPPVTVPRLLFDHTSAIAAFPEISIRNLPSSATRFALETMLRALGKAAGEQGLFVVEWFSRFGNNDRRKLQCGALWCAARIMEGVSDVFLDSECSRPNLSLPRSVERLARDIARGLAESWDKSFLDDNESPSEHSELSHYPIDDGALLVEHVKGLRKLEMTFDFMHVPVDTAQQRYALKESGLRRALSLQMLTVLSAVLGAKFSSLFLHALYPVLHSIMSSDSFVSATAISVMQHIAYNTAYASTASCLLSNFDYALDGVSQRLTRRRLDKDAPKVLGVLVSLVGKDIVYRAGDVIEECFDRLDDFHGYEILVEGLVEALGRVIEAVAANSEDRKQHSTSASRTALSEYSFDQFEGWLLGYRRHEEDESEGEFGPVPRTAWGEEKSRDDVDNTSLDNQPHVTEGSSEPCSPISAITSQIVERSIPFLTHRSPLIRARILSVLTASVPVLPAASLLPSVHKAWPYVLNRLADDEIYVVAAAATCIETLGKFEGDFMSQKIWSDVWPLFKKLIERLEDAEKASALTRKNAGGSSVLSAYTAAHRLYSAILQTITAAIGEANVPHDVTWDVALLFRRFLAETIHQDLQALAVQLYLALSSSSEDVVWLALLGTSSNWPGQSAQNLFNETTFLRRDWRIGSCLDLILGKPTLHPT